MKNDTWHSGVSPVRKGAISTDTQVVRSAYTCTQEHEHTYDLYILFSLPAQAPVLPEGHPTRFRFGLY